MEVNVNMSAEEFQEFMLWKQDRSRYNAYLTEKNRKLEMLANKACWAIGKDPKRPGKVKIVDQEHAAELLELANDCLS